MYMHKITDTATLTGSLGMWCRWLSVPQERVIFTEGKVPKYLSPGQQVCDCSAESRGKVKSKEKNIEQSTEV